MAIVKFELSKEEDVEYRNFVRSLLKDGFIRDNHKLVMEAIKDACSERIDRIANKPSVLENIYRDIRLESINKFNLKEKFNEIAEKCLTNYIENIMNDDEKMYKLFEKVFQSKLDQFAKALFTFVDNAQKKE